MNTRDLLLEIGVEELPSSFVEKALNALPKLVEKRLADLRLTHGEIEVLGTPRRLAVIVRDLLESQPNLEEHTVGPPARVAFKDGKPTRAAEAFAKKLGVDVAALETVETEKGEYLAGVRKEEGKPALELLPEVLAQVCGAIPFRKAMRWGTGSTAFGRPVRWLVALFGDALVPVEFAGLTSGTSSYGHRFLSSEPLTITGAATYVETLRAANVLVDPAERQQAMLTGLAKAAKDAGGEWIEDSFLIGENLSLVEKPYVVVGSFEERFLQLPDEVILEVAKGHQRYFGMRAASGALMPAYLAVVNTAEKPAAIAKGNDRVMRARLADAQFFFDEDKKAHPKRWQENLDQIVFHHRLGSVGDKVRRMEGLCADLGQALGVSEEVARDAVASAHLCKCDLVSLMVGEFPELQGVMGRAYALAHGESEAVSQAIEEHYWPKGASDGVASTDVAAIVALADRFDSLVGSFAVGLSPTGAADPFGLRRACLGILRTLLTRGYQLSLDAMVRKAYARFESAGVKLDLSADETSKKLAKFFRERLRRLAAERWPGDVVEACIGLAADNPVALGVRADALEALDSDLRGRVGEVFKRVSSIAKEAPAGPSKDPSQFGDEVHPSEVELFADSQRMHGRVAEVVAAEKFAEACQMIAATAPKLQTFFENVFVMCEDEALRHNRLRMLREIRDACGQVADFQALKRGKLVLQRA